MGRTIFERLHDYYLNIGEALKGNAEPASVFPNATDIGMSREQVYEQFLRQHAPSCCNVFFGGFVFDDLIHVAGNYIMQRVTEGMVASAGTLPPVGGYHCANGVPDLQAIAYVIDMLQVRAAISQHMLYTFRGIRNKVTEVAAKRLHGDAG